MHRVLLFLFCAALAAGGCAPKEWSFADDGAFDPLEPVNRAVFGFNKNADTVILKPLAKGYGYLPPFVRAGAGNFVGNLEEPRNFVNSVLQLRTNADAMTSVGRFVVNSSIGLGGFFDVASTIGWQRAENADFGRTLRQYGLDNTPYLVLPLLGPSSIADATGRIADSFAGPGVYLPPVAGGGLAFVGGVHRRYELLAFDGIVADAIDEYVFVRDIYEERRRVSSEDDGGELDVAVSGGRRQR